jgi:capsular polysaccharide biosynthesis protein
MKSIRHTLSRRWWLILLMPALTVGTTLFALPDPAAEYQASAILFVPSGAGQDGPGGANEAGRLAQQYTQLIPADQRIMQSVADTVGTDVEAARSDLQLAAIPDSSLVEITFSADTESEAVAGRDAVVVAVTEGVFDEPSDTNASVGTDPLLDELLESSTAPTERNAIPPNFLQVISRDVTATEESRAPAALAVAALIGGIVIGIAGAIALERADVRVDDIELAVRRTGVPGSDLDDMPDQSVSVLLRHWADLGSSNRVDAALLGVERDRHATTTAAARRLQRVQEGGVSTSPSAERSGVKSTRDRHLEIRVGGAPGTIESGEWVATDCSVTVLVIQRGTRLRSVEDATSALRQLDLGPTWLLLTDRAKRDSTLDPDPASSTGTPAHDARVAS